jgi:hypothetical protein
MERQRFLELYRVMASMARPPSRPGVVYSDLWIVLTYLWAAVSNRPISWACRKENWPSDFQWYAPPSSATMSRRLRTPEVQLLMALVLEQFNHLLLSSGFKHYDGKPLTVGGSSGDPDVTCYRASGLMARGYKLYCIWDASGHLDAWDVQTMNVAETVVAQTLIPQVQTPSFIITDGHNDSNNLYDLAGEYGHQWLAGKRKKRSHTIGHQYQSPFRLRALRMMDEGVAGPLLHARYDIERRFGTWGNCAEGLTPLPNWVRRLHRVRLWIHGKLIFYVQRLCRNKGLAA